MHRPTSSIRLLTLACFVLATVAGGCKAPAPFELTVLHTNDVHARVLATDARGNSCRAPDGRQGCFGGVARRATVVQRMRESEPNVVLLDAGDQFQGTLFFSRFKGEAAATLMNALHYDAMAVGNHELDDGPELLARFAQQLHFPLLAANLDASRVPDLDRVLSPSTVLTVGGHRIGIVGCLTEETATLSRPGPDIAFTEIEDAVGSEVRRLEADGVDIIVVLSHSGYERDLAIAAEIPGVDVLVGGHTNTYLANGDPDAEGPYPTVVTAPSGDKVLVVTAFAYGKYLGRLDVRFDAQGRVVGWGGGPILLDDTVPPDPAMEQTVAPFARTVAQFANEPIGEAAVPLEGDTSVCRFAECTLGDLIADALLEYGRPQGIEIALQNGGGIRSSIAQGTVTSGQILEVLPFNNTAATFGLRGEDLLFALEHGVSSADDPNGESTGRFLQVAGLRYVFTLEHPPGSRILEAEVRSDGAWEPIDPQRVYQIITNDFTRNGGDGFLVLKEHAIHPYDQGPVIADLLSDYIRAHSPAAPHLDGRIRQQGNAP